MPEILTLAEMRERFTDQWVLVEDPVTTSTNEIVSGTVVFQSPDRDLVYRKAIELRPKRFAIIFTGQMPAHTAIVV